MHTLASIYRAAQLYAHFAHNTVKGPNFFADHEFLGELYSVYETAYDAIIEREIGLGKEVSISDITKNAYHLFASVAKDADTQTFFKRLLATEKQICIQIAKDMSGKSDGTQNLLQGLADDAEKRQYQLKQRIG